MIKFIKHQIKVRLTAKPFDIWEEKICEYGKNESYWLGYDGKLYFGNRWFVFFESYQNGWWLTKLRNSYVSAV